MGKYCKRIVLLFLLFFATNSYAVSPAILHGMSGSGNLTECTETYSPNLAVDAENHIGRWSASDFLGFLYKPTSTASVCQIDVYVRYITGTLTSSHDYYCRIFSIDGNNDAATILGTSSKIDGDLIGEEAWISANAGYFVFDTPVALNSGTTYAITFFIDQDSDLDDDPEADADNYPGFGYDNERNLDTIQYGAIGFAWDDTIPYADNSSGVNDDWMVIIWAQ